MVKCNYTSKLKASRLHIGFVCLFATFFLIASFQVDLTAQSVSLPLPTPLDHGELQIFKSLNPWGRGIPTNLQRSILGRLETGPNSIDLITSAHRSRQDGAWVIQNLRLLLKQAKREAPIVVWIEHAEPFGVPHNVRDLQKQFAAATNIQLNWYEELLRNPMKPEAINFLRAVFNMSVGDEKDPRDVFGKTQEPFTRSIREGLDDFKKQGWNIEIKIEKPSFDAYIRSLQHESLGILLQYWLRRGQWMKALVSLVLAYRGFAESLDLRDQELVGDLQRHDKINPTDFNIVIRGLAHEKNIVDHLAKMGFRVRSVAQPAKSTSDSLDIRQYLSHYHEMPSARTLAGREFLVRQLFEFARSLNLSK